MPGKPELGWAILTNRERAELIDDPSQIRKLTCPICRNVYIDFKQRWECEIWHRRGRP